MIDLSIESINVQAWMNENIQKFLTELPQSPPTEIGLYSSPANGWISLCIDIDAVKVHWKTSCPDFTHPEYALLEFPAWSREYDTDSPMIKRHDSKVVRHDHSKGDESFNRHFFDFLMRVVNDHWQTGQEVYRPILAGAQILDSRCVSFARLHQPKS